MEVRIDPHARERLAERGATERDVVEAIQSGEQFTAKYGRQGFRRNFPYNAIWRGRHYATKQVEAFAVEEDGVWVVVTVFVKFF